jgi:hypothetical protein
MKNTWRHFFRRLAAAGAVFTASAWSSAVCYAQIAADYATDPAYADGWQDGDDGGTGGLGPWDFDISYGTAPIHAIDDGLQAGTANSSTFNNIGPAFRLALGTSNSLSRGGRALPLGINQTLRLVVDNPTRRQFFKGYIIRLSTGGGNICAAGPCTPGTNPQERLGVYMFDYDDEQWLISDLADDDFPSTLHDDDTAAAGVQIDITLTGPESYQLVMDPLGTAATFTRSGNLVNTGTGAVDWLEFVMFNTSTNTTNATDFYIRSIEIFDAVAPELPGDFNDDGNVDAADYVVWRKRNGTNNPLPNDNGLGVPIGSAHFNLWRSNFGDMAGSGGGQGAGAVPEPGTFVYFVAAMALLSWPRRTGVCRGEPVMNMIE